MKLAPDFGDGWAAYYRFEQAHGTVEEQAAVVAQCAAADPHHGHAWPAVAKRVEHWRKSPAELLALAVAALPPALT